MKLNEQYNLSQPYLTPFSPVSGLICSSIFIAGTIFSTELTTVSIFFFLSLLLTIYNKIFKRIIHILLSTNIFMLFVWLTFPFIASEQKPLITIPYISLPLYYKGLSLALLLTLKTNTVLLFFINFVSIEPHKLGRILQTIGLPKKLIILFILLYQNTLFLHKDFYTALQSLSLRAQKTNILLSLKLYAYLIGTILVHNISRANHIRMVLERRASPLLYVEPYPLYTRCIDIIFPLISFTVTIIIIY